MYQRVSCMSDIFLLTLLLMKDQPKISPQKSGSIIPNSTKILFDYRFRNIRSTKGAGGSLNFQFNVNTVSFGGSISPMGSKTPRLSKPKTMGKVSKTFACELLGIICVLDL